MSKYLVITQTEGGTYFEVKDRSQLLDAVNDGGYSDFLDHIPKFEDGFFQEPGTVIIKIAGVIVPREVKSVTEYTID